MVTPKKNCLALVAQPHILGCQNLFYWPCVHTTPKYMHLDMPIIQFLQAVAAPLWPFWASGGRASPHSGSGGGTQTVNINLFDY